MFDAGPGVADRDLNPAADATYTQADDLFAAGSVHGVEGVADEIAENLLNLNPIDGYGWRVRLDLHFDAGASPRYLVPHEIADLYENFVERSVARRICRSFEKRANPADDIRRAIRVAYDAINCLAGAFRFGGSAASQR